MMERKRKKEEGLEYDRDMEAMRNAFHDANRHKSPTGKDWDDFELDWQSKKDGTVLNSSEKKGETKQKLVGGEDFERFYEALSEDLKNAHSKKEWREHFFL